MSKDSRQMSLAAFLFPPGSHGAAWRLPDARSNADMDINAYIEFAQTAERGKMDMMFVQDTSAMPYSSALARGETIDGTMNRGVARLDPLTLMSAVAARTSKIGLVATATATYNEPYHIARKFLTLDHISGGRAGWNLVTSQNEEEAGNYGLDAHVEHGERYKRAIEFQEVVTGLWDSWEDDAIFRDKENNRYFDVEKVHNLDFKGEYFKVRGPLNVARSPQGRPIIAQAGSSEPGKDLAARTADVVFTAQNTVEEALEFYRDVKSRMAAFGRDPDDLKILPGINFMVTDSDDEAAELFEKMADMYPIEAVLRGIRGYSGGLDLNQFPLDGPLPELPPSNAAKARQQIMIKLGRDRGWSIRQIARYFALGTGHQVVYGTPKKIADVMEEFFTAGAADGFTMISPYLPTPLQRFVDLVVPELQRRGLFRTDYAGATVRDHLGLKRPENRFARKAEAPALVAV